MTRSREIEIGVMLAALLLLFFWLKYKSKSVLASTSNSGTDENVTYDDYGFGVSGDW